MNSSVDHPVTLTKRRTVYRNRFVTISDDAVLFASGDTGHHIKIVEGTGAPGVAAIVTDPGINVALVHVYRYAIGAWEWGVPRGFSDGSDSLVEIEREIEEELGCRPDAIRQIGSIRPNSGLLASTVNIFHATVDSENLNPQDSTEVERATWFSLSTIQEMVRNGEITDAFTLSALQLGHVHGIL